MTIDLVVAALVFPALVALLSAGLAGIIEWLGRHRLPVGARLPVGFAALIGLCQLLAGLRAPWGVAFPVVAIVALAGWALHWRSHAERPADRLGPWIPAAAVGVAFLILIAPVLLHGDVTSPGYLLDTTAGVQLQGADWIAHHGANFSTTFGVSTSESYLTAYFGTAYPTGAHAVLGYVGSAVPVDLLWLYTPMLGIALAISASGIWVIGRRLDLPVGWAFAAAVAAAVPALAYAYFLQGSIKEIAAVPAIVVLGLSVLALDPARPEERRLSMLVLAVGAAAVVAVFGLAGIAWSALAAVIWLIAVLRATPGPARARFSSLWRVVALGLGAVVLLSIPTILDIRESLQLASSLSQGNAVAANDPGNLPRPIGGLQALGTWVAPDHRAFPNTPAKTYILIGITLIAAALGFASLVRRRAVSAVVWFAGLAVIWWVLTHRGTMWTDAKLVVLASPWAVLLAVTGLRRLSTAGFRIEAVVAGLAVLGGIAWSDVTLYRNTGLMPTARYEELLDVADRVEDKGAVLLPDFDEYALYALRRNGASGFGFAHPAPTTGVYADGQPVGYGNSVDLDAVDTAALEPFAVIVQRRGPGHSRPSSAYRLLRSGAFYDVWERREDRAAPIRHVAVAGGPGTVSGVVSCRRARTLLRSADAAGGSLVGAPAPVRVVRQALRTDRSGNWLGVGGNEEAAVLNGPGSLTTDMIVPATGRWNLWLVGGVARNITITVDGRVVGERGDEEGTPSNAIGPIAVELTQGRHTVRITRGGGTLAPGDARPSQLRRLVLESSTPTTPRPVSEARQICGQDRQWDWFEVTPGPTR